MITNKRELYKETVKKYEKAWGKREKFMAARFCQLLSEKILREAEQPSEEWLQEARASAQLATLYGEKLSPSKYEQLEKIVQDVFRTMELTLQNGVD